MDNTELKDKIETVKRIYDSKQFKTYIEYIIFPYYRNLQEFTKITFDFPLSIFVGKNGSGKSSTLHALYGTPSGYSVGDYWFSTSVDPIKEVGREGMRHCFYYGYEEDNEIKEVLKQRAKRENNPDYWEPSKPVKKYKMNVDKRSTPITKNVVFMDFRAELSAFDKYFYFDEPSKNLASKSKQEYLRKQSIKLKRIFDTSFIYTVWRKAQNKPVSDISEKEIEYISYILGKKYKSGKIVEHKLFNKWGTSVILQNEFCEYSEAYAGSGEIAVVKLVSNLLKAPPHSLVLLDEPEVSLHPGAQKRLLTFLIDQMKEKKHQIIISTHSPSLIEGLPPEAIKVFSSMPDSGKFEVLNKCYPAEAFWHLEEPISNKIMLLFEDKLAYNIVKAVLASLGKEKEALFQLEYFPGGESVLKQDFISVYSREQNKQKFIIFDGDQKPSTSVIELNQMSVGDSENAERYEEIIKSLTNKDIKFAVDGNRDSGGRIDQKICLMKKYINYFNENVYFLPLNIPEEIIWDEECIKSLLKIIKNDENYIDELNKIGNAKVRIFNASQKLYGSDKKIEELEELLIARFVEIKNQLYCKIVDIINDILTKTNKL